MNSHTIPTKTRHPSRILLVLALLLGTIGLTEVSHAQSSYFTQALKLAGDASGTVAAASNAQLGTASATEAQWFTSGTAAPLLSDLQTVTGLRPAAYSNIILGATPKLSGSFVLANGGAYTNAIVSQLTDDGSKEYAAYFLSSGFEGLGAAGAVPTMSATVSALLSGSNLGVAEGTVALLAVTPLLSNGSDVTIYAPLVGTAIASLPGAAQNAVVDSVVAQYVALAVLPGGKNATKYPAVATAAALAVEGVAIQTTGTGSAGLIGQAVAPFYTNVASLLTSSGTLAAYAAGAYPYAASAVSGSASAAASAAGLPTFASSVATAISQVVSSSQAPSVAYSAAASVAEAYRTAIVQAVIPVQPTQDAAISGTVGSLLNLTDQEFLGYFVALQLSGLGRANDVPAVAAAIAGHLHWSVAGDYGVFALLTDVPINTATNINLLPQVALSVGTASGTAGSPAALASVAFYTNTLLVPGGKGKTTYPDLAIMTATGLQNISFANAGNSVMAAPGISYAFAGQNIGQAAAIGANAVTQYPTALAAVSGSVTAAAPSVSSTIATAIALSTSATNAALVSYSVSAQLNDANTNSKTTASREGIALAVLGVRNDQGPTVSGTVASLLSAAGDKEIFAYLVANNLVGTTVNRPQDIGPSASAIAATLNPSDAALSTEEGYIAIYAAVVAQAKGNSYLPGIALDIAQNTYNGVVQSASNQAQVVFYTNLLLGKDPSTANTTATTVEATSISQQTGVLGSGTAAAYNVAVNFSIPNYGQASAIAGFAAKGQSNVFAGQIGAAVVGNQPLSSATGVAVAVATAVATPATAAYNQALYDVATQFAAKASTSSGGGNISYDTLTNVAVGLASVAYNPRNTDAIAAIDYAIASKFTSASKSQIDLFAFYVGWQQTADSADALAALIIGLHAAGNSSETAASLASLVIAGGEYVPKGSSTAAYQTLGVSKSQYEGFINNALSRATGGVPPGPYDGYNGGITPNETPVVQI